jgi:ferredoxin
MASTVILPSVRYRVERVDFDRLLERIRELGYEVIGPAVGDGSIRYEPISGAADMPLGWEDSQEGGTYRLRRREDELLFAFTIGADSWKRYLFPSRIALWSAGRENGVLRLDDRPPEPRKLAFVGVRSCDLHAIAVQDRVFTEGTFRDPYYARQRENLCLVAVNCSRAGGTCFCVSMGTGPRAETGFDLALTEIVESPDHFFIVDVGSELGVSIISAVPHSEAGSAETETADDVVRATAEHMGRSMETTNISSLLKESYDHSRWEEVASRCLTCGNCTLVCPTCFCSSVEDTTDLTGSLASRERRWESCFTTSHSYIHGGSVRTSAKSRYRHWMTHKLGTWWDQFDTSGCVGCGRCITWCPVGIDITEEVAAIRAGTGGQSPEIQGDDRGDA